MRVPKFKNLGAFLRFKRLWIVSNAHFSESFARGRRLQDRARMIQHVNTVFSSKSKKMCNVFNKKNT